MLYYAAFFLVIALIAAVFGFSSIALGVSGVARLIFVAFLAAFVVALILGLMRQPPHR